MQYHLNGFRTGNPSISRVAENTIAGHCAKSTKNQSRANEVDVLIVGCGPSGLTLAGQLCEFPELTISITERKSGPLSVGQADGIACRSLEMFQSFGFAEKVLREAYFVNEVAFWRPEANGAGIHRADIIQDVEDDLSEMPHVILNQARVHDFYLEHMHNSAHGLTPEYNRELIEISRNEDADYPLSATFNCVNEQNKTETIKARYIVGCDGARSTVRQFIGQELKGGSARQLWGVMDILAVTNFPDIRKKAAIQSATQGSLLIIPREGGYLVRMYIELDQLHGSERASDKNVTPEMLVERARAILSPHTLDVKELVWWSAYEIGQRVCDEFDNVTNKNRAQKTPDIFIAGDACHTHSPKAGQGMNVGMADSYNLGWKLAAVIRGQASPALLHTYSLERQAKARELIDFDKDMARLFSDKPKNEIDAAQFQQYFKKHARYTAGVETKYEPSIITRNGEDESLAGRLKVGMRFHSEKVIRLADAKPVHLGHTLKSDGRWRFFIFANTADNGQPDKPVARLCEFLAHHANSPIVRFTPVDDDIDSVFDVRAVFQSSHRDLAIESMPSLLRPQKGIYGLVDYEKIFCADTKHSADIFDSRAIDRANGALVMVRPDQYIASVLSLDSFTELSHFFDQFMVEKVTT